MVDADKLKSLINKELENFVVKDTFTKGKNAGLRKVLIFIQELERESDNS